LADDEGDAARRLSLGTTHDEMAYGRPLGCKGALVVAAVIGGSSVLASGLLWGLYLAVTYRAPPAPRWADGMACEPGTSPGYHGYIMRCVTPAGKRVEFRDVEWERRTRNLPGPMD
jgi:hypothetical protein